MQPKIPVHYTMTAMLFDTDIYVKQLQHMISFSSCIDMNCQMQKHKIYLGKATGESYVSIF